jgi:branched-chain amino acid transport system permease protein
MKLLARYWWIILLLLIALYPPTLGGMSPYRAGVLIFVGIYIILAVSLDLLMGYTGQISVGHAAFFAIGAYVSGILTAKCGVSPLLAMIAGMALSAAVAWAMGRPVLALKEYYLAMATLALNEIVVTLIIGLQWLTGGASGLRDVPSFSVLGFNFDNQIHYYYLVWAIVVLVVASSIVVARSPFGRTLIAIHSDETAAKTFGIDCAAYKVRVYVLSAIFASIAGSLFAHHMGFLAPDDFSVLTSINILVMLYLGGIGTIYGAALGAVFLKLLPEVTLQFQDYEMFINGVILIIILVFVPKGLFGIVTEIKNKLLTRGSG